MADQELQAAWLARYFLLQAGKGVARVYWYGWGLGQWGTLSFPTGQVNLAGAAYGEVYNWLVGSTMSACSVAPDRNTWSCSLTRPGGYRALAVWSTSGERALTPVPAYKRYRDLAGHEFPVRDPVRIGLKPILLETRALTISE